MDDVLHILQSLSPKHEAIAFATAITIAGMLPMPLFNLLVLAAGFRFGPNKGFAIVYFPALLGASCGFALGRRMPNALRSKLPHKVIQLQDALAQGGFINLFLLRLTPLPFGASNLFFGSVPSVSYTTFIEATALGFIR